MHAESEMDVADVRTVQLSTLHWCRVGVGVLGTKLLYYRSIVRSHQV
jgi:hypothetical protein